MCKYTVVPDNEYCLESDMGAGWPGDGASDYESRGHGFDTHTEHRVVSLSKREKILLRVLVNTQEVEAPSRHD